MKILKYILGFFAVVCIVFVLLGVFIPQIKYGSEVTVNAPVEKCWEVFIDETKMSQWLEGYKSVEVVSGRRNEVGAVYNLTFEQEGQPFEMTETVTEYKENEVLAFDMDNEWFTNTTKITFEAMGDQTKITSSGASRGKSWGKRSMFVLASVVFKSADQKAYNNLKDLIEKGE